jgi:tRNA threonylcarbamoyladenosine biosynthesis protein TsaB
LLAHLGVILDFGSWFLALGSWLLVFLHSSCLRGRPDGYAVGDNQEQRTKNQERMTTDNGPRTVFNPKSKIQNPKSTVLILAFNTTDEHGGAAIYRGTESLAATANESAASYSISLFQMVEDVLRRARLSLRDIDLFAVAHGPGSFTGIRVGVAAAQAWGTAFSRPVCGVSVLEAMVEEAQPDTRLAVPILDARRGEFFVSLFEREDSTGVFASRGETLLMQADDAARFLSRVCGIAGTTDAAPTPTCIARQHDVAAQALAGDWPPFLWRTVPGPLVHGIACRTLRAQEQGRLQSPAELDALYVRRTDAEMKWRD